jgi:biopolymer transport protein ExbD
MARLPAHEKPEESNMTPMIDVVFQLLIFFMLTMKFSEVEGRLLATLPRGHGQADTSAPPELNEVRIRVTTGQAFVERRDAGPLASTERHPNAGAANRATYRAVGSLTRDLLSSLRSSRDPSKAAPVLLDGAENVPYEHVIGIFNACQEAGIINLEFVGNPRFMKETR